MAHKILLTAAEQQELLRRKKHQRDGKILRRLICLDMKQKGMQNKEIAAYCDVCIDTITDWLCLFEAGGFEALCSLQYDGRRTSKLEQLKAEIAKKQQVERIETLKELKQWLEEKHGVQTCISNLCYFCKKNSILLTKKHD